MGFVFTPQSLQGPTYNKFIHVQVSIDSSGALTAALAGLANLPAKFFDEKCSDPKDLAAEALKEWRKLKNAPRATLEDEAPDT